jgi:hypothetical protein
MWKEIPEQYKSELDRLNKMTSEEMDKFMADLRIRASRVSQPMAPEELMAKLSNLSIQGLGMFSRFLLQATTGKTRCATCVLKGVSRSHCDVTARAEAQMRDMHISPA